MHAPTDSATAAAQTPLLDPLEPPARSAADPRGVPGIPVLGNSLQLLRSPAAFFDGAYRKHGPIFKVDVFFQKYTVLAGREGFAFFMKERERYFSRTGFYAPFAKQLGTDQFILGEPADLHAHLRGQMRLAYSRQVAAEFIPDMIEAIDAAIDRNPPGSRLTVMDFIADVAFDQYTRVMCGRSLKHYFEDTRHYVQRIMDVGTKIWPEAVFNTKRYQRSKAQVFKMMGEIVDIVRAEGADDDHRYTIMEALLAAKTDEGAPMKLDDQIACALYGFVGTIIYINRAVSFLLYDLITNPDVMGRVIEEADDMFDQGAPDGLALRGLNMLPAALKESMRLHPIALALPFIVEQDFEFEGHQVRKGEYCVVTGVPGHFSDENYKCPHQFDADRILPPREEHKKRGAHVPFGFSIRTCPAVGLVETIVFLTISRLVHRRRLEMHPPDHQLRTVLNPLPAPSRGFRLRMMEERWHEPREKPVQWALAANAMESLVGGDALHDPRLRTRLGRTLSLRFDAGDLILREGDKADAFYILMEGEITVTKGESQEVVGQLFPGDFFGERGLLGEGRRLANCRAATDVVVLRMGREDFMEVVRDHDLVPGEIAGATRRRYLSDKIQQAIPSIDSRMLQGLLEGGTVETHPPGAVLVRQGDFADAFYVVLRGKVQVLDESTDPPRLVRELGGGEFFGEIGILESSPRVATVRVVPDGWVEVLAVSREALLEQVRQSPRAQADIASVIGQRVSELHDLRGPA